MKGRFFVIVAFTLAVAGFGDICAAQSPNNEAPIEISADQSLEWLRDNQQYVARGNAIAKQGNFQIDADQLTALYTENEKGETEIWRLMAQGNVIVKSPPHIAYGDKAVYDVETSAAVLTGNNLRLITPTETVTAKDSLEYWSADNKLLARGRAKAMRAEDKMEAELMTAYFKEDAAGELKVSRITAQDNVAIITKEETVYGDKGVYNIPEERAVLTGDVRIQRGLNWLNGGKAEVDLKSGISQLFARSSTPDEKGRVSGVFYPQKSERSPGKQ